ncbi:putative pterin-binding protein [Roseivivax sp. CAU 1761]
MIRLLLICVALLLSPRFAAAEALPAPAGMPLLTVSGQIAATNAGTAAQFDRDMLEALDWREIETFTSFTEGPQRFAGPTLVSLLDRLGAEGSTVALTALNDYRIEFPLSYAADHDVLLTLDHDGAPMSIRRKGPIWVVFPLDEAGAAAKRFDGEMIWQLDRLQILD